MKKFLAVVLITFATVGRVADPDTGVNHYDKGPVNNVTFHTAPTRYTGTLVWEVTLNDGTRCVIVSHDAVDCDWE